MNKFRKTASASLMLLALLLSACSESTPNASPPAGGVADPSATAATPPADPPIPASPPATEIVRGPVLREAKLVATGDIMVHSPQLPAYYDPKTKRYAFDSWFDQVRPILQTGDWVFGNLETPIAGQDLKYTGYPRFNAPAELADALVGAGFQIVSTANNHTMDRGVPGIVRTLANVRRAGLVPVGTAADEADAVRLTIEERNGIRMGFLAYTYGTNGIPVPADRAYAVNLIDKEKIQAAIAELRDAGADVVAVSLHFGQEYHRMPNNQQILLARALIASGADIVLGSHPHVVQPYERVDIPASESPDGRVHRGVVIYSLGNFISNQSGDWKDVGVIFSVDIVKTELADGSSTVEIRDVAATPTWVHIATVAKKRHYTIVPMAKALRSRDVPGLTSADYTKLKQLLAGIDKHLTQKVGVSQ